VQFTKPAFIVALLPESTAAWIHETRRTFEPAIAGMPVEITLAGSSGVGPISPGQDVERTRSILESTVAGRLPFDARFTGIDNFPGTEIFFAAPEQEPFVGLHRDIADSGIAFQPSAFPYRAHCSLKGFTPLRPGQRAALLALSVPSQPFTIRTISVYEIEGMRPTLVFSIG
jgi:hypothetical protein